MGKFHHVSCEGRLHLPLELSRHGWNFSSVEDDFFLSNQLYTIEARRRRRRQEEKSGERWKKRNACLFGTLFSTNLALLFILKTLLFVKCKPMKLAANFISKDPFRLPFLTRRSNSHAKALGIIF